MKSHWVVLFRLAGLLFLMQGCGDKDDRPNILWITCEDISSNLGCYDDLHAYTPNLDALAKRGVLYNNAFASAPVCAVARSTIISGLYASSLGSQHMRCKARRPSGQELYPELLRAAGYYCTNNAKTDYNLDMDNKSIWDQCDGEAHWRSKSNSDQPFFSIFNFTSSHESRVNDEERYIQAVAQLSPELLQAPGDVPLPPYFPRTPEVEELWARYYNIITAMDQQVGELLTQLVEDGLHEETIVVFYSDHGAGVPRHKRWLYDSGLRVPMIVFTPEKYRDLVPHGVGTQTDELVSFIDLAPTALHLAQIPVPAYMEGRAFLGEELSPPRKYVFAGRDRMDERYDMQRAVRDKQYKYVRYYQPDLPYCQYMNTPEKGGIMRAIRDAQAIDAMPSSGSHIISRSKPKEELFDCHSDPNELVNLANDPQYQDKLEELRQAHNDWSDDTKDTGLLPETILRDLEATHDMAIYDLMRTQQLPTLIMREAALNELTKDELITLTEHEQSAVRYWSTKSLGKHPLDQELTKKLIGKCNDVTPLVRFAAAKSIYDTTRQTDALAVLVKGLQHEDEWVRLGAALSLDELGEKSRPALSALDGAMSDKNKYVVRVVNHTLNLLENTENIVP